MKVPVPPNVYQTTNERLLYSKETKPNQLSLQKPAGYAGKAGKTTFPTGVKTTGEKLREQNLAATRKQGLSETMRDAPKAPGLQKRAKAASHLTSVSPRQAVPSMDTIREPLTQKVREPRPLPADTPTLPDDKLNVRVRDRDGTTLNLKQFPWPSDKAHTTATTSGATRGNSTQSNTHGRPHASDFRVRPDPRPVLPPGYKGHVPKIGINSSGVGQHFGDNTEQAILKRVVKHRNEEAIHLMPILYNTEPLPTDVTAYKKAKPVLGKEKEKEELQKTFGRHYREGADPALWEGRGFDKTITLEGLQSNKKLIEDANTNPFPPFPSYHR